MGRKVDVEDLVGTIEVADRLGLAHVASVHTLMRRYDDFPEPLLISGRTRIWAWSDVEEWAKATGRLP